MIDETNKTKFWFSTRFFVAVVCFFGCAIIYGTRVNLSVALVCMVNKTYVESNNLKINNNQTIAECEPSLNADEKPPINGNLRWTKKEQGILLGSFFWGYAATQILGGLLAQKIGATSIITLNLFVTIIATFLTPYATQHGLIVVVFLRILLGAAQGVTFPAFHSFWSIWSPPLERSILTSISYAGCQVGSLITLPVSTYLCRFGFADGWPSIFYVLGIVAIAWVIVWILYVRDSPSKQKFISEMERNYILESLRHSSNDKYKERKIATPWKHILQSKPVWAIIAAHWAADWAAYTMLTSLPIYLSNVLQLNIEKLGILSAVPFLAYFIFINLSGFVADFLRSHNLLSTANTRKVLTAIALLSQAIFLVAAGYCTCGQVYLVIVFLTLGIGLSGLQYGGLLINYMDVAPRYAGTILGIGNTLSCFSGILSPFIMGVLTPNGTRQEWLTVFWLTASILIVGTIIYVVFAKGDTLPWAVEQPEAEEMKDLTNSSIKKRSINNNES